MTKRQLTEEHTKQQLPLAGPNRTAKVDLLTSFWRRTTSSEETPQLMPLDIVNLFKSFSEPIIKPDEKHNNGITTNDTPHRTIVTLNFNIFNENSWLNNKHISSSLAITEPVKLTINLQQTNTMHLFECVIVEDENMLFGKDKYKLLLQAACQNGANERCDHYQISEYLENNKLNVVSNCKWEATITENEDKTDFKQKISIKNNSSFKINITKNRIIWTHNNGLLIGQKLEKDFFNGKHYFHIRVGGSDTVVFNTQ